MREFLKDLLTARGLLNVLFCFILFYVTGYISTRIHEFGHWLIAKGYGCEAVIVYSRMVTGGTWVKCPEYYPPSEVKRIIIRVALAGPFISLLFGALLYWGFGRNSILRLMGLIPLLYSYLPNLLMIEGSDMWVAVENGLHPLIALLIIIASIGIVFFALGREVTERRYVI